MEFCVKLILVIYHHIFYNKTAQLIISQRKKVLQKSIQIHANDYKLYYTNYKHTNTYFFQSRIVRLDLSLVKKLNFQTYHR